MSELTCANCGTPLSEPGAACPSCDTQTGITTPDFPELPGFEILRLLGRGGMGAVYLADDLTLGRKVAIKLLADKYQGDREARDRFLVEARALAGIDHPNVLRIHSLGEAEGAAFIVTEYVEGESLAQRIARGPMPTDEVLRLARQAAAGLAAAWEKGIVHRDVKPSNLLVDAAGQLRVADFGLAKPVRLDMSFATSKGVVLGTPHYVSPEQARGEPVDLRSDIYSLGVALYEMAAGKRPFGGSTPVEILAHHIHSPMPPLAASTAQLSPVLEHAISRMTQKRPADRPGSYAELSKLLTDDGSTRRRVGRFVPAALAVTLVAAAALYVSAPSSELPAPAVLSPASAVDLDATYDERNVDVPPKYLSGGTAASLSEYLPDAKGKEGCLGTISVAVEFVVTPSGDVTEMEVKSTKLAGGAMLGISTRKYSPARKGQSPVRVRLRRRYEVPSYFKSLAALGPQVASIQQGKMPADAAVGCIEVLGRALASPDPAFSAEAAKGLAAIASAYAVDDADLESIGWILSSGHPDEARQVFEARIARLPDTAREYERIADGLAAVGQRDAAIKTYRLALALEPGRESIATKLEATVANPEGTFNGARVYTEAEADTPPKLVRNGGVPRMNAPPGEATQALVSWVVTPKGDVAELRIHRSTGLEVDQLMNNAISKWGYEPGKKGGEVVPVKVLRRYTFAKQD